MTVTTNMNADTITEQNSNIVLSAPCASGELPAGALISILGRWWIAFAASAVFVVSGHLLIKAGLNSLAPLPGGSGLFGRVLHVLLQPQVFGGLLIYVMGTVCWMRAVSQKEISFLYPLSSVNYVLVAVASTVFFHEVISTRRAAGVLIVVLGMILMNTRSRAART